MPQRLRFQNILDNALVQSSLNTCDETKLRSWANAFELQAISRGRWWGTTQLVQFCLGDSGCLVLPRQVAVIEAANLGAQHVQMRNAWYEFIKPHAACENLCCNDDNCNCGCGPANMSDMGTVASFNTTTGSNKKLRVYPSQIADIGKKIIFQGNDSNGIWVRTEIDGVIQDGEEVTLALPFVDTDTTWGPGAPVAVVKEITQYRVLVYAVDPDDNETQLAIYEPTETEPAYRRVKLAPYRNCSSGCNSNSLWAIVSLDHVPIVNNSDWMLMSNIEAYRLGMMSVKAREDGNTVQADALLFGHDRNAKNARGVARYSDGMSALSILRAEVEKYTAGISSINIQTTNTNLAGFM
jgi:hypothetical protein